MSRLDMIPQDLVKDGDYCDICGANIPLGSPMWLDIPEEHTDVPPPAYCKTCADKITKEAGDP